MPGAVLLPLAQFAAARQWRRPRSLTCGKRCEAGSPVCWAAGTLARREVAEQWLAQTREQLTEAAPGDRLRVRKAAAERWADRFADLLDEDPPRDPSFARWPRKSRPSCPRVWCRRLAIRWRLAGREHRCIGGGGIAAGVIHGNVAPPGPTLPGPAKP